MSLDGGTLQLRSVPVCIWGSFLHGVGCTDPFRKTFRMKVKVTTDQAPGRKTGRHLLPGRPRGPQGDSRC